MKSEQERMVHLIKNYYGLSSLGVLSVMLQIPREEFVSDTLKNSVYEDVPISIGYGQTMSQPYTVAFMTHLLRLTGNEKVLEIGTGSGYQSAVLSKLAREVYTIEIIPELYNRAKKVFDKLGFFNIHVKSGNGAFGWKKNAPFDVILITAGLENKIPSFLLGQLKMGGVLVVPMGEGREKKMIRLTKVVRNEKEVFEKEEFGNFRFVPFTRPLRGIITI